MFLVDGNFDDKTTLTVAPVENSALVNGKAVAKQWHLVCSDSSQDSYTVRYLSPNETAAGYSVFVQEDGDWQKVTCSEFGSYLVFSATAAEIDVAIVPVTSEWLQWAILCAVMVAVFVLLIVLCKNHKKKRRQLLLQKTLKK